MEKHELNWGVLEAAQFLKVRVSTIYNWVHQRKIPFRKHGSRLVFSRLALEEWSLKREIPEIDDN